MYVFLSLLGISLLVDARTRRIGDDETQLQGWEDHVSGLRDKDVNINEWRQNTIPKPSSPVYYTHLSQPHLSTITIFHHFHHIPSHLQLSINYLINTIYIIQALMRINVVSIYDEYL